jgi:hypothetical protein
MYSDYDYLEEHAPAFYPPNNASAYYISSEPKSHDQSHTSNTTSGLPLLSHGHNQSRLFYLYGWLYPWLPTGFILGLWIPILLGGAWIVLDEVENYEYRAALFGIGEAGFW